MTESFSTYIPLERSPDILPTVCATTVGTEVPRRKILLVEDTAELAELLVCHLKTVAGEVRVCDNGRMALAALQREAFDLAVLDIGLPGMNGLEICRAIRTAEIATPVLILSARASELDRIVGLEFGADDYVTKPFSVLELLARVKAIFRRAERRSGSTAATPDESIPIGPLLVIPSARQVFREQTAIPLTEKEFDLLLVFASNPGRVFTRHQLLDHVWGFGNDVYESSVTSHINRLRAKIETDVAIIQTVWGVGYRLHASLLTTSKTL